MLFHGTPKKYLSMFMMLMLASTMLVVTSPASAAVSQTPPMGWNSYDCFNFSVTESEVKANADYMATNLKSYGWQYIVVDWCWSFPGMGSQATPNQTWTNGQPSPRLNLDSYGRPMPDTTRHPSSVGGAGFKPLADYVHSKGLKFGIHIMRGIPRQAVTDNTPIYGTSYHAADIADTANTCPWLNHNYGLNMSHPGAQAYLNSLFQLYASWGVDFVKVDDLSAQVYRTTEVEGYRTAINNCGREMVFSTSPGATPLANASHVSQFANQWRMANDLWDNWSSVNAMFDLAAQWYPYAGAGHWPDADMIPIGKLSKRGPVGSERYSGLTNDEKYTLMTLWSIIRSPLIWGGNLVENDATSLTLMTNSEVIAVNQNSTNNRLITGGNLPIWCADVPGTSDKYVAIFNRTSSSSNITVNLSSIGISGAASFRDLWAKSTVGTFSGSYTTNVGAHQTRIYKVSPTTSATSTPTPTGTPTPTPTPGPTFDSTAYYKLVCRVSGKLADVSSGSTADGADVIQWTDNGGTNQQWKIVSVGGGYHKLLNRKSGKALDVYNYGTADGDDVVQWTDNGQTNQQWIIADIGGGYYKLTNVYSGKVLDVYNSGTADGADIVQWTWNGGNNQQWQIIKIP